MAIDEREMPDETLPDEEDINEIVRIRREKLMALIESGKNPFEITEYRRTHLSSEIVAAGESLVGSEVRVSGRIVSKRMMGKASFAHILDGGGRLQIYVKIDNVGGDAYEEWKKYDIGDIVGVAGKVFITHKGEISVAAEELTLLVKSLLPLPEKWHGLKDNDLRYRQRYVDLIANPGVKETFVKRSKILRAIRNYLDEKDFIEVETPILNTIAGGANARPFISHHNTLDIDMFMRIAPELYLKRLIVGGFDRVYEIGRMFRNEGMDIKHNPEFTMMELYQAYANLDNMMEITEGIYAAVAAALDCGGHITYQGTEIDLSTPWQRLTMTEAVKRYTGLDFASARDEDLLRQAQSMGVSLEGKPTRGKLLYEVFDQLVEPKLIQPVFITEYPVEVSPLAKRIPGTDFVYRFEFFIYGREMGNAFGELNDPLDQKARFEAQAKLRDRGDDEAQMTDEDYVTALEYGLPPTGGLGIGVDRMVMLFTDSYSIRDVLLFPTMKIKK